MPSRADACFTFRALAESDMSAEMSMSLKVAALAAASFVGLAELPISASTAAPQNPPGQAPVPGTQAAAPKGCRVTGKVTMMAPVRTPVRPAPGDGAGGSSTTTPAAPRMVATVLPGATIVVRQGTRFVLATATDAEGKFSILFTPGQTFKVSGEFTGFATVEHDPNLGALPCDATLDFLLTLVPRDQPLPKPESLTTTPTAAPAVTGDKAAANATTIGNKPPAAGQPATPETGRFTQLTVQTDTNGAATLETTPPESSGDLSRLLPPGFSLQGANADAITINGSTEALNVDRNALNDRMAAVGRGEFDPATGQFAEGFGPAGGANGGGQGQNGGAGGGAAAVAEGAEVAAEGAAFVLGGRHGRGQSLYQGTLTMNYGGAALDSVALQPVNGVITPQPSLPFNRTSFGGTIGGPLKIPGIYEDTNRRTTFQINYTGNHSTTLQQAFTTVPTDAERGGDFSASPVPLINPQTGQPFANNQIPMGMVNPAALALLAISRMRTCRARRSATSRIPERRWRRATP